MLSRETSSWLSLSTSHLRRLMYYSRPSRLPRQAWTTDFPDESTDYTDEDKEIVFNLTVYDTETP
jgi:hypothetical protein